MGCAARGRLELRREAASVPSFVSFAPKLAGSALRWEVPSMTRHFDEFSKSLADERIPRRESLRRFGAALVGALFAPLALRTASAGGPDPCKAFCNQCPRAQRSRCLTACHACNNDPSQLCTDCWSYDCCLSGETCCGNTCHDLASDFGNCGACHNSCGDPGPYEIGACVNGQCKYWCVEGAVVCNGECSLLDQDPDNCGGCGNVCPDATPICSNGICIGCPPPTTNCNGYCANLATDWWNCGACGNACFGYDACVAGTCENVN